MRPETQAREKRMSGLIRAVAIFLAGILIAAGGSTALFAQTKPTITTLGPELDRSKGSGRTHDAERDPGHYVDLDDSGSVMSVVSLAALPPTREEYDTLLRKSGLTQYAAGYLPYSIVDGWQQLRRDFALWRVDVIGASSATTPEDRAWSPSPHFAGRERPSAPPNALGGRAGHPMPEP